MSSKQKKLLVQPINAIFRLLQSQAIVQIWLFEAKNCRIEGKIIGFDEYMNIVLDDANELDLKKQTVKNLGRIMLKGDAVTLIMQKN